MPKQRQPAEVNLNCVVCGSPGINRVYHGLIYCETHYYMAKAKAAREKEKERAKERMAVEKEKARKKPIKARR